MHGIIPNTGTNRRGLVVLTAAVAIWAGWVAWSGSPSGPRGSVAAATELAQADGKQAAPTPPVDKTEPGKPETSKPDTAKADPAKIDPAKTESPKSDPAKAEAAKTDPAKVDASKADAGKADAGKADAAKPPSQPAAQVGPQTGTGAGKDVPHAEAVFIRLDVNPGDNQISPAEFGNAVSLGVDPPPKDFAELDRNQDGFLTLEEFSTGYTNYWLVGLIVVAVLVAPFAAGNYLAKFWRLPEYSLRFGLILFALTAAITAWSMGTLKYGIDLRGGVILVYGVDDERSRATIKDFESSGNFMDELVAAISMRVNPGGTKEVIVRKAGQNQVEIIVPDATKADIESTKRRVADAGYLELSLAVNDRTQEELFGPRYAQVIEQAQKPEHPANVPHPLDGRPAGRWVVVDERKFPDIEKHREGLIVRKNRDGHWEALLSARPVDSVSGPDIASASSDYDNKGQPAVMFTMSTKGAGKLQKITSEHLPEGTFRHRLAIVYDNKLRTAPVIEGLISERGQITGYNSPREVQDIVAVLNAGRLPAVLKEQPESEQEIGATLGADTIIQSRRAAIVSVGVIFAFSLVYYKFAGFVACLVLLTNTLMLLGVMVLFKVALTLPGVAGLVLNIGMAVDANILIYERMREEREKGASLRMQIRNGFDKAASAIIDSNLTTLLTAIVLWVIGTDQVKGFAATLTIGILNTLFTAIFVGRVLFEVAERKKWIKEINMLKLIGKTNINFIGIQRPAIAVSVVACVLALAFTFARGKSIFDIDFAGGSSVQILLYEPLTTEQVREKLQVANVPDVTVSEVTTESSRPGTHYKIDTSLGSEVSIENSFAARDKDGDKRLDVTEFMSEYPGEHPGPGKAASEDYAAARQRFAALDTRPPNQPDGFLDQSEFGLNHEDVKVYWLRPIFGTALRRYALTVGEPTPVAATAPPVAPPSTGSPPSVPAPPDGKSKPGEKQSSISRPVQHVLSFASYPALTTGVLVAQADKSTEAEGKDPKAADAKAPDAKSVDAKAPEAKPDSSKPQDVNPATTKPIESKPAESKQEESKPAEAKPADSKSPETKAPEAKSPASAPDVVKQSEPGAKTDIPPTGTSPTTMPWITSCSLTFADPIKHSDLLLYVKEAMRLLVAGNQLPATTGDSSFAVTRPGFRIGETRSFRDWTLQTKLDAAQTRLLAQRTAQHVAADPNFPAANTIGGQVAGRTQRQAVTAIVLSVLGIVVYLWIRFEKVMYGLAAAIALIHDVLVTLGAVAVSAYIVQFIPPLADALAIDTFKVSLPVIAALLTIVGYSVNDTIVIFDRIREVRGRSPKVTPEIVNLSVNSTLSRSILTSFATLLSALVLYAAGGDEIHPFAFCICVGVIAGSYSTIYIASPILLWLTNWAESRSSAVQRAPVSAGTG